MSLQRHSDITERGWWFGLLGGGEYESVCVRGEVVFVCVCVCVCVHV